jgi:dUTP pyrophosphatase
VPPPPPRPPTPAPPLVAPIPGNTPVPAGVAISSPSAPPARRSAVETLPVRIKRVGNIKVSLPAYQTALAAGLDLSAAIEGPLTIAPMSRVLVPTGLAIALPPGFEGQVRPRSGLAWSRGLTVLNSPGTVDADYRGEIKVLLVNLSGDDAIIEPHERIAQMVIARHARAELQLVDELDDTPRGEGGYGSTGVR